MNLHIMGYVQAREHQPEVPTLAMRIFDSHPLFNTPDKALNEIFHLGTDAEELKHRYDGYNKYI